MKQMKKRIRIAVRFFPSKIAISNLHAPPNSRPQYCMLQRDMNNNVT